MGVLRWQALDWATAVWENQTDLCSSFQAFIIEMRKVSDHPVPSNEAVAKLFSLCQGSRSVAEYAIKFQTQVEDTGCNLEVQQVVFLSEALKDGLAARDEPEGLNALFSLYSHPDNCQREWCQEKQGRITQRHQFLILGHDPAWPPNLHYLLPHP